MIKIVEFSSMSEVSLGEVEGVLTEEKVVELLEPYREALLAASDDSIKKEWLKSKNPELQEQDIEKLHTRLILYAASRKQPIFEPEVMSMLRTYNYVDAFQKYGVNVSEGEAQNMDIEEFQQKLIDIAYRILGVAEVFIPEYLKEKDLEVSIDSEESKRFSEEFSNRFVQESTISDDIFELQALFSGVSDKVFEELIERTGAYPGNIKSDIADTIIQGAALQAMGITKTVDAYTKGVDKD